MKVGCFFTMCGHITLYDWNTIIAMWNLQFNTIPYKRFTDCPSWKAFIPVYILVSHRAIRRITPTCCLIWSSCLNLWLTILEIATVHICKSSHLRVLMQVVVVCDICNISYVNICDRSTSLYFTGIRIKTFLCIIVLLFHEYYTWCPQQEY